MTREEKKKQISSLMEERVKTERETREQKIAEEKYAESIKARKQAYENVLSTKQAQQEDISNGLLIAREGKLKHNDSAVNPILARQNLNMNERIERNALQINRQTADMRNILNQSSSSMPGEPQSILFTNIKNYLSGKAQHPFTSVQEIEANRLNPQAYTNPISPKLPSTPEEAVQAEMEASDRKQKLLFTSLENQKINKEIEEAKNSEEANYGFAENYGGEAGNIDINHRKIKYNDDGSISTERNTIIGVEEDGKEKYIVIPTVIDGEAPDDENEAFKIAEQHYYETGENLGKFDNLEEAKKYSEDLSQRQARFYLKEQGDYLRKQYDERKQAIEDSKWYRNFKKGSEVDKKKQEIYADGYQFGDVSRVLLQDAIGAGATAGDLTLHFVDAFEGTGLNLASLIMNGVANVEDFIGGDESTNRFGLNTRADRWRRAIGDSKTLSSEAYNKIDPYSWSGDTTDKIATGVGYTSEMALYSWALQPWSEGSELLANGEKLEFLGKESAKATEIAKFLGATNEIKMFGVNMPTLTLLSSTGGSLRDGYSEDDYNKWLVQLNAVGEGYIDAFTEGIFDSMGVGGSTLSDTFKGNVMSKCEHGISKAFARTGLAVTGEEAEEILGYFLNYLEHNAIGIIDEQLFGTESSKYKEKLNSDEFWETVCTTALTTLLTEGSTTFAGSTQEIANTINNIERNENRSLSLKEQRIIADKVLLDRELAYQHQYMGDYVDTLINNSDLTEQQKINVKEAFDESFNNTGSTYDDVRQMIYEQKNNVDNNSENTEIKNEKVSDNIKENKETQKNDTQKVENELKQEKEIKNNKTEEKQQTTIKNKPLLDNKQQTTQKETKTQKTETSKEIDKNDNKNAKKVKETKRNNIPDSSPTTYYQPSQQEIREMNARDDRIAEERKQGITHRQATPEEIEKYGIRKKNNNNKKDVFVESDTQLNSSTNAERSDLLREEKNREARYQKLYEQEQEERKQREKSGENKTKKYTKEDYIADQQAKENELIKLIEQDKEIKKNKDNKEKRNSKLLEKEKLLDDNNIELDENTNRINELHNILDTEEAQNYTPEELNTFEKELKELVKGTPEETIDNNKIAEQKETNKQEKEILSDADYNPTEEESQSIRDQVIQNQNDLEEKYGVNLDVIDKAKRFIGDDDEAYRAYRQQLINAGKRGEDTTGIKYIKPTYEQVVDKGLNFGERILESLEQTGSTNFDYMEDEEIENAIEDKLKLLNDMKKFNVISSLENFSIANNTTSKSGKRKATIGKYQEIYNYVRYLDEKLKKALYEGTKTKYDMPTEFDSDRIHDTENISGLNKKTQDLRQYMLSNINDYSKDFDLFKLKDVTAGKIKNKIPGKKGLTAIKLDTTTPLRVNEKVFGFEGGKIMNDITVRPIHRHMAEENRFYNSSVKKVREFNINRNSVESEVISKLIEKYEYDENGKKLGKYTEEKALKELGGDKEKLARVLGAKEEITSQLKNLFNTANNIFEQYGMPKIEYRDNYIPHYQEISKAFSEYFYRINGDTDQENKADYYKNVVREISKKCDEITFEGLEKSKPSFGNEMQRKTNKTGHDAIYAYETYLKNIGDVIFLTEDIQRNRAIEQMLRQYALKENINVENDLIGQDKLTDEQWKQMKEMYDIGAFDEYLSWFHEWTNILSGKEAVIDETMRKVAKDTIDVADSLRSRIASNLTTLNLVSASTNLISSTMSASQTRTDSDFKALGLMMKNFFTQTDDGFLENSDTWTIRQGIDYKSNKKGIAKAGQKARDIGGKPMNWTDNFATEFILRSKYDEGLKRFKNDFKDANGKIDVEALNKYAMEYADEWASRILGERRTGLKPIAFESKLLRPATDFQLEVRNQKDIYNHDFKQQRYTDINEHGSSELKADAKMIYNATKMTVFQHVFNNVFEMAFGTRPAFDIIQVLKEAFGYERDDDDEDENRAIKIMKKIFGLNVKKNDKKVSENIMNAMKDYVMMQPFINVFSDNSRVPLASFGENALQDIQDVGTSIIDYVSAGTEEEKETASKELKTSSGKAGRRLLTNVILPIGGAQVNRTLDTIDTYKAGGNYRDDGRLRYPIQEQDKTPGRKVQALLFGRRNLPSAKEYEQDNYRTITPDQAKVYNSLDNISFKDYKKIIDSKKKEEKIETINSLNPDSNDKWNLYESYVLTDDQISKAYELMDNGLTDKESYLDTYDTISQRDLKMPNEETVEKMIEYDVSLDSWTKYITDRDNMKQNQKYNNQQYNDLYNRVMEGDESIGKIDTEDIDSDAKATILMDKKYNTKERESLFMAITGGKDEVRDYKTLKALGGNDSSQINTYLNYLITDTTTSKKAGKYDNKTSNISGSRQKKIQEYMDTSDWTPSQKAYIKATNAFPSITNYERQLLDNYAGTLSDEEYNEFYNSLTKKFVGINYNDTGKNDVVWINKYIK